MLTRKNKRSEAIKPSKSVGKKQADFDRLQKPLKSEDWFKKEEEKKLKLDTKECTFTPRTLTARSPVSYDSKLYTPRQGIEKSKDLYLQGRMANLRKQKRDRSKDSVEFEK